MNLITDDRHVSIPELAQQIESVLRALLLPGAPPDGVFELRGLGCHQRFGSPKNMSGFYDAEHLADMAEAAARLTIEHRASGVYYALNVVHRDCLSVRANRCDVAAAGELADDGSIVRLANLLIDADPRRRKKISSTADEKAQALDTIQRVRQRLDAAGWPAPFVADSGNGYHLVYRIDLPPEDSAIVQRCLKALSQEFSTDQVEIDQKVFNPSRISKVYGTYARKGDNTPDRPHRMAQVIDLPHDRQIVPRDLLVALAATATNGKLLTQTAPQRNGHGVSIAERASRYLDKLPDSIEGQDGSARCFHAACVLVRDFSLSIEEAFPILEAWNTRHAVPPWSESELRHKLADADKVEGERGRLLCASQRYDDLRDYGIDDDTPRAERKYNPDTDRFEHPRADPEYDDRPPIEKFSIGDLIDRYPTLHRPAIQGLIRVGETANIISTSKIGKSWLAYYIALSVATARTIFDRFPTHGGSVLLIDNELHRPTIAQRIKAVAEAMGIDQSQYAERIDVWPLRGNLRDIHELIGEFEGIEAGQYELIVLDAKYRMIPDAASENDNAAETRFYNTVDRLAERTGAAVLMVHHSSKGSQSDKRVTDVGAGAGAQSRAADCHLILREHDEDDAVVLAAAVRSFPPVEPVCLRWRFPLWEVDDDLDPAELKGKKSELEERQAKRDAEAQSAVLDACATWRSQRELRKLTGFGEDRLNRTIARLLAAGYLSAETQTRRGNECEAFRKTIHAR